MTRDQHGEIDCAIMHQNYKAINETNNISFEGISISNWLVGHHLHTAHRARSAAGRADFVFPWCRGGAIDFVATLASHATYKAQEQRQQQQQQNHCSKSWTWKHKEQNQERVTLTRITKSSINACLPTGIVKSWPGDLFSFLQHEHGREERDFEMGGVTRGRVGFWGQHLSHPKSSISPFGCFFVVPLDVEDFQTDKIK